MDRHDNENNVAPPPPARAEVPLHLCNNSSNQTYKVWINEPAGAK